ncbi:hypothetical protein TevJSym_az00190 [endosymbiont of Tevnia jerichonana (vent Tica)]|uniref:Uncharacterized protein n=1 Tax=endosymbiont of Tevnia jerichonana (vent Tica) TaxID=1049564 RepID=G2FI29_9GAMM|nr:hypothetical protein TevJSym_az00190 [endosymbiont of Tevnia jerichonana (vent Tica)]
MIARFRPQYLGPGEADNIQEFRAVTHPSDVHYICPLNTLYSFVTIPPTAEARRSQRKPGKSLNSLCSSRE